MSQGQSSFKGECICGDVHIFVYIYVYIDICTYQALVKRLLSCIYIVLNYPLFNRPLYGPLPASTRPVVCAFVL